MDGGHVASMQTFSASPRVIDSLRATTRANMRVTRTRAYELDLCAGGCVRTSPVFGALRRSCAPPSPALSPSAVAWPLPPRVQWFAVIFVLPPRPTLARRSLSLSSLRICVRERAERLKQ